MTNANRNSIQHKLYKGRYDLIDTIATLQMQLKFQRKKKKHKQNSKFIVFSVNVDNNFDMNNFVPLLV